MLTVVCPHCNRNNDDLNVFCLSCAKVLPLSDYNPFLLLGLETKFDLDKKALNDALLKKLLIYHPDRFINADNLTKEIALKNSSMLNNAAKKLKNELSRSEVLLSINDFDVLDYNKNFQIEMNLTQEFFEMQEAIDEQEGAELLELYKAVDNMLAENYKDLAAVFLEHYLDQASLLLVKRRFLLRMKINIENKLGKSV